MNEKIKTSELPINADPTSGDFVVGVTDNGDGTFTTNRYALQNLGPYKSYVVKLTQSGVSAPTETVIFNNTGQTPAWGYSGPGEYTVTGVFAANKYAAIHGCTIPGTSNLISSEQSSADVILLFTWDSTLGTNADVGFTSIIFELRIYP